MQRTGSAPPESLVLIFRRRVTQALAYETEIQVCRRHVGRPANRADPDDDGLAEYLESGGYDRYLTRLRIAFAEQVRMVSQAAAKYFPEGTRITRPDAGYLLWVELPKKVDAVKLFRAAMAAHITIVPDTIFSTTGRFRNCIRISCGYRWSDAIDRALVTLGRLAADLERET